MHVTLQQEGRSHLVDRESASAHRRDGRPGAGPLRHEGRAHAGRRPLGRGGRALLGVDPADPRRVRRADRGRAHRRGRRAASRSAPRWCRSSPATRSRWPSRRCRCRPCARAGWRSASACRTTGSSTRCSACPTSTRPRRCAPTSTCSTRRCAGPGHGRRRERPVPRAQPARHHRRRADAGADRRARPAACCAWPASAPTAPSSGWPTSGPSARTSSRTITAAAEAAGRPAPRVVAGIPVCLCGDDEVDAAVARTNRILSEAEVSPNYQKLLDHGDARDGRRHPRRRQRVDDREAPAVVRRRRRHRRVGPGRADRRRPRRAARVLSTHARAPVDARRRLTLDRARAVVDERDEPRARRPCAGRCSATPTSTRMTARRRSGGGRVPGLHHRRRRGACGLAAGRSSTRDRSLLVLAMTAALGRMDEFRLHAASTRRTGRDRRRARRAAVPDRGVLRRAGRASRPGARCARSAPSGTAMTRDQRSASSVSATWAARWRRTSSAAGHDGRGPRRRRARARARRRDARRRASPRSPREPRSSCSASRTAGVRRRWPREIVAADDRAHHPRGRHVDGRRRARPQSIAELLGGAGIAYVDAPVSGGVAGARARTLVGDVRRRATTACAAVEPVLAGLSDRRHRVGDRPGMAQAMKLANNFLSATALAATSEADRLRPVGRARHGDDARGAQRRQRAERRDHRQVPEPRADRSLRQPASPTR